MGTILNDKGGGGGGRTRANSVCFTKNVVKIGAFPNATPTSKIWKNLSVDQKDQRRRSVWVGHADFSKIAQRKQKFIKHVNSGKLMHSRSARTFHHCLQKRFISVYTRI